MPTVFTPALDCLRNWETDPYFWIAQSADFGDSTSTTLADLLVEATEVTVDGYERQVVDTPTRTIEAFEIHYCIADQVVAWGGLSAGENVVAVTLCKGALDGDDADTMPVCTWQIGSVPTSLGIVPVDFGQDVILRTRQGSS